MKSADVNGFGLKWAGKLYGTNTGNLYVVFEGSGDGLSGVLRVNDDQFGLVIYDVSATYLNGVLKLSGVPKSSPVDANSSNFTATGKLDDRGQINGTWETKLGTAGTFVLHSHDLNSTSSTESAVTPPQLYTKRHKFKSIEVTREDIVALGGKLEQEFPSCKVVVTVATQTDRASFLRDFEAADFLAERATAIKLFVQSPERDGLNRVVSIEFGQIENFAITQSTDEAWAIGRIERLKDEVRPFERRNALNFRFVDVSLPQYFLLAMIVYLPSIEQLSARVIYVLAFVGLISAFVTLHNRYVPNALILLKPRKESWVLQKVMALGSWIAAIFTAFVTYLLTEKFDAILQIIATGAESIGN